MKKVILLFMILSSINSIAQKKSQPTDAFKITGDIKKELVITLDDIEKFEAKAIDDITIKNHQGVKRGTLKKLEGVLVKDILSKVEYNIKRPKELSQYYLSFTAVDGYKVVYSWNEILNSATGENVYVITSVNGDGLKDMRNRILVMTSSDYKAGRRHVKYLNKIEIRKAE